MLGDLHIHMVLDGVNYRAAMDAHRPQPCEELIRRRLLDYRDRGITFLRDGGDAMGVSLRAKVLAADYDMDYRSPAFPIYKRGHYGGFIGRGFGQWEEYLTLLDKVRQLGGDFVKIMISGLIDFSQPDTLTEEGLSPAEIRRMIDAAHNRGFAVMAHANGDTAVNAALDAQVDTLEHGAFLSERTLERLANSGTVWIPTLSTIGNLLGCGRFPDGVLRPLLLAQQKKVARVAAAGGIIGLGSDGGAFRVYHGQCAEDEENYLKTALGSEWKAILARAEALVRTRFRAK